MELVLNTFGTSLHRDNEGFVITHKDGKQRIPSDSITSILISKGAQITSDAVMLAIDREIEVLFTDNHGNPVGRIWSPRYGSISTIRKGQINFSFSHAAVKWIKDIIRQKIENQQALIMLMSHDSKIEQYKIDRAINRLEDYRNKLTVLDGEVVSDISATLRGWEGVSSKIYFEILNLYIPEEYRFLQRTQHPAMDPVNALLNYGYGLLYGKIEGALIKAGIDPYIGVLHRDNYNRPVLVYDVIELYRIWVDYIVYTLVIQGVITEDCYSKKEDGSVWLEGLGRRILIQSFNDYLDETVEFKGLTRSRLFQISLYCQNLAQQLKKYEKL